jgi:hypothetical protein
MSAPTWKPIETLPCDGTPVAVLDMEKWSVQRARMRNDGTFEFHYEWCKPSHWMELPRPKEGLCCDCRRKAGRWRDDEWDFCCDDCHQSNVAG